MKIIVCIKKNEMWNVRLQTNKLYTIRNMKNVNIIFFKGKYRNKSYF